MTRMSQADTTTPPRAYTPEAAGRICQVHPDNIRKLARKVATRKTKIFVGWNSGKYYHGDLMERAMALLLGLTGNWGRKGTGTRSWAIMGFDGNAFMARKQGPGQPGSSTGPRTRNTSLCVPTCMSG